MLQVLSVFFKRMRRAPWLPGVVLPALLLSAAAHAAQPARVEDSMAQRMLACAACHDKEGRATAEGYFPRIAGKPAGYLYNQLVNFRDGRRQYPMMGYMVQHMSDAYLAEIAHYFADLHLPYVAPPAMHFEAATLEQGRLLVMKGDPTRGLPACIACHGEKLTGASPAIPSLVALPRDYLNAQFGAWRSGARHSIAPDCMATISKKLTPYDVSAVSAWLASQPVPQDMTPAVSLPAVMPLQCGSAAEKMAGRP